VLLATVSGNVIEGYLRRQMGDETDSGSHKTGEALLDLQAMDLSGVKGEERDPQLRRSNSTRCRNQSGDTCQDIEEPWQTFGSKSRCRQSDTQLGCAAQRCALNWARCNSAYTTDVTAMFTSPFTAIWASSFHVHLLFEENGSNSIDSTSG
jgi:hypothetical protein